MEGDTSLPAKDPRLHIYAVILGALLEALYPINYVAADELRGETSLSQHYTPDERAEALRYIDTRIALVRLPEGLAPDEPFLRKALLTMYANPVYNKLRAHDPS